MSNFNPFKYLDLSSFTPEKIQALYVQFLNNFPLQYQPLVSIVLAILIIYSVFRIIKRDFIFIIALAILFPASIPVMKSIWFGIIATLNYLFGFNISH